MDNFDYELQMENEYETSHSGDIHAGVPAITTEDGNNDGTRYYKETVKEKKNKGSLKKIVLAGVICAVVGAPILGVSTGIGMKIADNYFGTQKQEHLSAASSPSIINQTARNISPVTVAAPSNSIVELVKEAQMSVVNITTSIVTNDYFYRYYFYGSDSETPGSGTGIVFYEDDECVYIMTNYHVVENANKAFVSFIDREQIPASLIGASKSEDVAVITVLKSDLVKEGITDVTIAKIGDSQTIEVGEWVIAIGNALGNGKTVTYGIVSAVNKEMDFSDGKKPLNFIQTDAAINPGNSGGALVDMNGFVIGMNTAKIADYRVDGMGFAIPINSILSIAEQIVQNKTAEGSGAPYIGISGGSITKDIVDRYSLIVNEGVIIQEVFEDGGAADAGLRSSDIIIEMDGQKIKTIEQLQTIIASKEIGTTVNTKIIRNNDREVDVIIKIKERTEIYTLN